MTSITTKEDNKTLERSPSEKHSTEIGSPNTLTISSNSTSNEQDIKNLEDPMNALSLADSSENSDDEADDPEELDNLEKWHEAMLHRAAWKEWVQEMWEEIFEEEISEDEEESSHVERDYENRSHETPEPRGPSAGIAEYERVRMADGSTKMVKDLVRGDFVMGPHGNPVEVKDVKRGYSQLYEVSIPNDNGIGRRKVAVGARQPFKLSIGQCNLRPVHVLAQGNNKPRYEVTYRSLTRERVEAGKGDFRQVTKVHETTIFESYDSKTSHILASTPEEAKHRLYKKLYANLPRDTNGKICTRLQWIAEARDLNLYKPPCMIHM